LHLATSNGGSPAPDISEKKTDKIFHDLEDKYGVRHDDPFSRNITYDPNEGRFCVIDFELATLLDMPEQAEDPS